MIYYIDGGTANNGQFGKQRSIICVTNGKGVVLKLDDIGDKTNNEAELTALLWAISQCKKCKNTIYSDSQLAVNLALGKYHTKIDRLVVLLNQITPILALNPKITVLWIPREKNLAGFVIEAKYHL